MPNNVPDISVATASYKKLSLRLIDKSGDKRTETVRISASATPAQIQAFIVAFGNSTNASVYSAVVSEVWETSDSVANAVQSPRSSVFQNVVTYWKVGTTLETQDSFIPAPVEAMMVAGTDTVDTTASGLFDTYKGLLDAILPAGYDAVSVRYSERKEVNSKTKL